jgi:hypothetical protein
MSKDHQSTNQPTIASSLTQPNPKPQTVNQISENSQQPLACAMCDVCVPCPYPQCCTSRYKTHVPCPVKSEM